MQNSINPFNIRPANRVNNISEYYFSKKLKEIAELNARGLDIINLGIGGPDRRPTPKRLKPCVRRAGNLMFTDTNLT